MENTRDLYVNTAAIKRAFYWWNDRDSKQLCLFDGSVYHAIFIEGQDLSKPEAVADIATSLFVDKDGLLAAL
jgi:2-hydroxychromene-2-carboxylate isomerase